MKNDTDEADSILIQWNSIPSIDVNGNKDTDEIYINLYKRIDLIGCFFENKLTVISSTELIYKEV